MAKWVLECRRKYYRYLQVITQLLTIDPNFQRDIQVVKTSSLKFNFLLITLVASHLQLE